MYRFLVTSGLLAALGLLAVPAAAVVCVDTNAGGTVTRTWTLDPATGCKTGSGNPLAADILADWPSDPWTPGGDITAGGDASPFLDITFTMGAFDDDDEEASKNTAGTWTLAPSFWLTYGEAVISIHVGGGPDDLDDYASFLLPFGETGGTWSYVQDPEGGPGAAGVGGGLSNFHLWGRGTPAPEPGSLALLGLALAGLAFARRRAAA